MYGIFTYIYHKYQLQINVKICQSHGLYGVYWKVRWGFCSWLNVAQDQTKTILETFVVRGEEWFVLGFRWLLYKFICPTTQWEWFIFLHFIIKKMKLTIHVGKYTIHWVCWHNCVSLDFFPILTRHFVHDTSKNTLKTARFWHPMTFQGFLGRGVSYLPGSSWANVDLPFAAANGWLGAEKGTNCVANLDFVCLQWYG